MFKLVFGLVAALLFSVPSDAEAAFTPTLRMCSVLGSNGVQHTETTCLAAYNKVYNSSEVASVNCSPAYPATSPCNSVAHGGSIIRGGQVFWGAPTCPANSTGTSSCTCNSGFTEFQGACYPPSECTPGKGRTFNRTEGWARTPDADANDVVSNVGPPAGIYDFNDGVCIGNITSVDRCYRSQEPSAQGLHRISCDYTMVVTGTSSSAGDAASLPTTPNAACPGFVGEVNGKTVCVGTASSPLPSPGNAPNEPTVAGNPSAGVKPATGEGSGSTGAGRTPTAGSGGNSGGPAGAAVGRGGTGDRGEDGEDGTAVCGAPPLPACNVKVDETGTPTKADGLAEYATATTKLAEEKQKLDDLFDDIEDYSFGAWTWSFALPTGCTPFEMYEGFVVDPCQWQDVFHELMTIIWLATGICGAWVIFSKA